MNLGPETEIIEYKRTTAEQKAATDSLVAMLNKHGHGVLYFGVRDDGTVIGQQISAKTLREVAQTIRARIVPAVYPQVERVNSYDRECVRVEVTGKDVPYASAGVYFTRVGDEDVRLSREELADILHERHRRSHPWDFEASDFTIGDVDERELQVFVHKGQDEGRITFAWAGVEDALMRLRLMEGDRLTNAAATLFVESRTTRLQMAVYGGETRQLFLDTQRIAGTLPALAREAEAYVVRNLKRRIEFSDTQMQRIETPEIPFKALREIIYNALVHRDYERPENVQIDIFADRVEVFSPGALPPDMDVKAHIEGRTVYSRSRNQLVADTVYKSGEIEAFGSGLPRVKELCDEAGIGFEVQQVPQGVVAVFGRPDWQREFAQGEGEADNRGDDKHVDKNDTTKASAGQIGLDDLLMNRPSTNNSTIKSTGKLEPTRRERDVLLYVSNHPAATQQEVAEELGVGRGTIARHISSLQAKGFLHREGARKKGTWVVLHSEG